MPNIKRGGCERKESSLKHVQSVKMKFISVTQENIQGFHQQNVHWTAKEEEETSLNMSDLKGTTKEIFVCQKTKSQRYLNTVS